MFRHIAPILSPAKYLEHTPEYLQSGFTDSEQLVSGKS